MKDKAVEILGAFAYNAGNGVELESRIDTTIQYLKNNPNKKVVCKVNNNWSKSPSGLIDAVRVGGTTYKYQVWIGVENV